MRWNRLTRSWLEEGAGDAIAVEVLAKIGFGLMEGRTSDGTTTLVCCCYQVPVVEGTIGMAPDELVAAIDIFSASMVPAKCA